MYSKTIFFAIVIVIAVAAVSCKSVVAEEVIPQEVIQQRGRSNRFLFSLSKSDPSCNKLQCPPYYCYADGRIIVGYCCGCRRTPEVLPIYCDPNNRFCPDTDSDLSDVCHDYEYMLRCCCKSENK